MALSDSWHSIQARKVVSVRLFGAVKVQAPGQLEQVWRSQKAATVLGYLASKSGSTVTRAELVERFWPDSELKQARASLRQLLYELRGMLEPPGYERAVIQSDNNHIWIVPGTVTTDVELFDLELERSKNAKTEPEKVLYLESAVGQFGGPFLESVEEPWALHERSRYDNRYCAAVCELTEALCHQGEASTAIDIVQRALRFLPLRQDLHVSAMRAYAAAGEVNEALKQFDTLERALEDELGEEPSQYAKEALQNLPGAVKAAKRDRTEALAQPDEARRPHFTAFPRFRGSPFLGRSGELLDLQTLLDPENQSSARIVTVTGPVGSGKTRLAAEALESLAGAYDGRTCVVVANEHLSESSFWVALASALRPEVVLHDNVKSTVLSWLGSEPVLMVIDDCDRIRGSMGKLSQDLLESVQNIRLLLTSRAPLGLDNEQVYRIGPLAVPTGDETLRELLDVPSVRLFWETARLVEFSFQLTQKNAPAISKLCQLLDGLPLAIALAAGRISVFRPQQMLDRLLDQKNFLKKRERTGPAHHASLEAAMTWTFESLSPAARELLPVLSVFRSGFEASAAESVAGVTDIYDLLEELVSASWLLAEDTGDSVRFGLLNSISTFAGALAEGNPERETWTARHSQFYSSWLKERSQLIAGHQARAVSDEILRELPNLFKIVETDLSSSGLTAVSIEILDSLRPFFELRGHTSEWLPIAKNLLEHPETGSNSLLARGLFALGMIAFFQREFDTMESAYLRCDRILADEPEATELRAGAKNGLGLALRIQGKAVEAVQQFKSAIAIVDERVSANLRCKVHFNLGITLEPLYGFDAAIDSFKTARDIAQAAGLQKMLCVCISSLVRPRTLTAPSPSQLVEMQQALAMLNELGDERAGMYVAANLGFAYYLAGDVNEGVTLLDRAIRFDLRDKEWRSLRSNLAVLAMILAESGLPFGAKVALEAHAGLSTQLQEAIPTLEQEILQRVHNVGIDLQEVVKASRFTSFVESSLESNVEKAIDDSLSLTVKSA